jgi:hypothetical protein
VHFLQDFSNVCFGSLRNTICIFKQSIPLQFYYHYICRSLLDHLHVMYIYQNYKKLQLQCIHNMPMSVKADLVKITYFLKLLQCDQKTLKILIFLNYKLHFNLKL